MKSLAITLTLGLLVSACTQHPKVSADNITPVTFVNAKATQPVLDTIMELCSNNGLTVEEGSKNAVICSGDSSAFDQFLFGSNGGSTVLLKTRYNAFVVKNQVKVVGSSWFEHENFYGQSKRTPAAAANQRTQNFLNRVKAEVEAGGAK